jgi:predicted permease
VVRQLLVESLTLSAIGGAVGIVCAVWTMPTVSRVLPPNLLPVPDIAIDRTVLAFSFAATLAAGLLFGVVPSWRAGALDLNSILKQTSRSSSSGARLSLRSALAAGELALAMVLLIGAGLLIQTLFELRRTDVGFRPSSLLTFQLSPPTTKYPLNSGAPAFYRSLLDSVRALPGVRDAAVSSGIPFGAGNYTSTPMTPIGPSELAPGSAMPVEWRVVSPRYFATFGVPLLRGRDFTDADASNDTLVTVISASTAQKFWGSADPIGRTLRQAADTRPFQVVGVVGDVRSTNLNQQAPALYLSAARRVWPLMDVVVRTDGDPKAVLPSIRHVVRTLDPQLPIATVRTMDEWLSNTAAQPRRNAQLLAIFAAVALLVATLGVYGVIAYSVHQRTREIGLRMALGAPPGRVLRQVIGEGMSVGAAGIGAGVAGALAVSRVLSSVVVGVGVDDPATYVGVAAAIAFVTLAACVLPARRASRIDPIVALREE